jgi:hypothetical protein
MFVFGRHSANRTANNSARHGPFNGADPTDHGTNSGATKRSDGGSLPGGAERAIFLLIGAGPKRCGRKGHHPDFCDPAHRSSPSSLARQYRVMKEQPNKARLVPQICRRLPSCVAKR